METTILISEYIELLELKLSKLKNDSEKYSDFLGNAEIEIKTIEEKITSLLLENTMYLKTL